MKMRKKEEMVQQSSHLNKKLTEVLNHFLERKTAFVIFKKPLEDHINIFIQTEQGNHTFELEYFNKTRKNKIKGSLFSLYNFPKLSDIQGNGKVEPSVSTNIDFTSKGHFEDYVRFIIQQCKNGKLTKCVAARKKKVNLPQDFSLSQVFLKACEKYKNAFVHLSYSDFGLWLGASPELLLANNKQHFSTVSLAGTKTINENRNWTSKEFEEQKIVTDFILQTIKNSKATSISVSDTYTAQAGHLQHLKTDISFDAPDKRALISALHPTPAVCGTPKDKALEIIEQNENYQRDFYTGYIGLEAEEGFYYVNLRCMQFFSNYAAIYVGAGITVDSNPNAEWMETENKALTMESLIINS